jgi:hypothetical protein
VWRGVEGAPRPQCGGAQYLGIRHPHSLGGRGCVVDSSNTLAFPGLEIESPDLFLCELPICFRVSGTGLLTG